MATTIIATILKRNLSELYYANQNYNSSFSNLPTGTFNADHIRNAIGGWLLPSQPGNGGNVVSFSTISPNNVTAFPAIQFEYAQESGAGAGYDSFWVSGSISDFVTKANASTGGAASTFTVTPVQPVVYP
jgi:hypothetical protein